LADLGLEAARAASMRQVQANRQMVSRLKALTCPSQSLPQPRMCMRKLELRLGGLQYGDGLAECVQSVLTALGHCSASQRDAQAIGTS
jgi:hypothetical protein